MIILPDKNAPRSKYIIGVPKKEWMIPSLVQPKDQFGRENRTYFVIRAHAHDGKIVWRGVYEDREDFDAVLWAIANDTLKYEKELWPLSTPNWDPWIGELPQYSFVTYDNKTSPTGSNQTYNKPSDWDNGNNKIECIGAGASGAWTQLDPNNINTGGGGGAYSKITNFSFTGSSAIYEIGTGGPAGSGITGSTPQTSAGTSGGSTWFNNTANPGNGTDNTKCSAQGGSAGISSSGGSPQTGAAGGATTSSWGQTKYAGGNAGSATGSGSIRMGTGGGGAGCSTSAGSNGQDNTSGSGTSGLATNGGNGGTGDNSAAGGTGGAGTNAVNTADNGTAGTNLSSGTVGSGGGGGGISRSVNGTCTAGSGGNYGAGGGGCFNNGAGNNNSVKAISGAGIGGLIVISYTPQTYRSGSMFILFN